MLTIDQTPSVAEVLSDIHDGSVQNQDEQRDIFVEEKGKEKEKENDGALESSDIPTPPETPPETPPDVTNVDWTKYEPPEGLMHVGSVQSALVMQVVQESIDRIKARILEAEQERLLAEEEKQKQEEAVSQENEEMRQSGSLDDQLRNDSVQVEAPQPPNVEEDAPRTESRDGFPSELPKRPRKRGLMGLFRKLNTGAEHGESSAAGAARHRLLASSSSAELTYSARKRFVLDLIRKSTGEDTSTIPTEGNEVECVSCLDDFNPKDTVRAPCHNYCVPCFRRLIASACQNEQHWPPKCCLNNIPDSTIITNVDEQQRMEYRERALEWNLPIMDRIYCSQSECSQFIRPEYIIPGRDVARCTDGHYTCTICRNPQHDGADCPQDYDLARTNELAEEEGWKRCYGCKASATCAAPAGARAPAR
ncbi:hypothetical protein NUW58_g5476 [Xylaria curta]|uniref:Uncharacterized protein n=1 Tax=Xylaria curta TaxID=42375 RepID=A0ACC1P1D6_9PEZI|nr:hypothetical protein NUW58_g5476 [Xylaria curta]